MPTYRQRRGLAAIPALSDAGCAWRDVNSNVRLRLPRLSLSPKELACLVYPTSIAEWTGVVKWLVPVLTVVHVSAPLGGLLSEKAE